MKPKFIPLTLLLFSAVASSEQVTMKCTNDDVYRHTTEVEKSFFSRSETTYRVEERFSGQWTDWCKRVFPDLISCEIYPDGAALSTYGIVFRNTNRKTNDGESVAEAVNDPLTEINITLDFVLFTKVWEKRIRNEKTDSVRYEGPVITKCEKLL